MDSKKFLIILVICIIPFSAYLLRDGLWNTDTFYFASVSCGLVEVNPLARNVFDNYNSIPILSQIFFDSFFCSDLTYKLLFFVIMLVCSLILWKIGELYSKEYGWLAPVVVNLSTYWIVNMSMIEDDLLAMPFLLLSLYFFVKGKKESRISLILVALFFVLLAGLLWKGALLYLIGFSLSSVPALILTLLVIIFVLNNNIGSIVNAIMPNFSVIENLPLFGFFQQFFLLWGFRSVHFVLPMQFLFFGLLALLNVKFGIHLAIFLSLGVVVWIDRSMNGRFDGVVERFIRVNLWPAIVLWIGAMVLISSLHVYGMYPHENQIEAVDFIVEQAGDEGVMNDWSYGYYILYAGGHPSDFGGGPDHYEWMNGGWLLTEKEFDCELVRSFGLGFEDDLKVYYC